MKKMLAEFQEFAMRGSVTDLAVGVIIGGAFGTIVSSFVDDILMPPLGLLVGNVDFSNLYFNLSGGAFASFAEAQAAGAATINYGLFLNAVVDFIIIAFAVFLMVRQVNRLKRKQDKGDKKAPKPAKDVQLLTEIRDILAGERVSRETTE